MNLANKALSFRLYIESELCDTARVTVRLNKVVRDPQNINRRSGSFSYTIRLPQSPTNKRIFGQAQELPVASKFTIRETYRAELLGPNGEVLLFGTFKLTDITNTFNGVLYSNEIFWAQLIQDKSLRDIQSFDIAPFDPFADPYGFEWYLDRDHNTVDINFPLIAYGNFFDGTAADNYESQEITQISTDDWLPSTYYLNIIKKIFTDIGYGVNGKIFDDQDVQKWMLPFTGEKFSYGALGGAKKVFGEPVVDPLNATRRITNAWEFTCKSDDTYEITHSVLMCNYDNPPGQGDISITVYEPDGSTVILSIPEGSYTATVNGDCTLYEFTGSLGALTTGDLIVIFFVPTNFIGGAPDFLVDQIYTEENWEIKITGQPDGIDIPMNLPDINQKDFVGSFITFFNLFFEVRGQEIFFFSESEYEADQKLTIDITNYVDLDQGVRILRDDIYRTLRWTYDNQDDDDLLADVPQLGNHDQVDQRVANNKVKQYQVPFSATVNRSYEILAPLAATVSLPTISRDANQPLNEVIWEFDHTPRIIKFVGKSTVEIDVQGNDVPIGLATFANDQQFENLVAVHYPPYQNIYGNLVEISGFFPPEMAERLVQRYRIQFNGDLYKLAAFTEYDPSRKNPAKLLMIKEIL